MIDTSKIVQAICYLLNKVEKADKLKIIKLLYLADKYHILRYGRTVTNDEYWAMDYGPVGSVAKDILGYDSEFLSKEFKYTSKMLKKLGENTFTRGEYCSTEELESLSETDMEALDFVTKEFGKQSTKQLIKLTHIYPEWEQYKELFNNKLIRRERIQDQELLSSLDNDVLAVPKEHLEESKRIILGFSN